ALVLVLVLVLATAIRTTRPLILITIRILIPRILIPRILMPPLVGIRSRLVGIRPRQPTAASGSIYRRRMRWYMRTDTWPEGSAISTVRASAWLCPEARIASRSARTHSRR